MGKASREKGKRGEREFCELLREHGFEARRGVQFAGGPDSPDVVCVGLPCHFEVKRTETFSPSYLLQAQQDARPDLEPVVVWKRNNDGWRAFCDAHHYIGMHQKVQRLEDEILRLERELKEVSDQP